MSQSLTNECVCRGTFSWVWGGSTYGQPPFVFRQLTMELSLLCWRWRRRHFSLFRLQKHNTLFQVEERRFSRCACWCWWLWIVGMKVDVVRVIDLHENIASLRCDLEQSLLKIVRHSVIIVFVIVRPRTAQMYVIPKACGHFYLTTYLPLTQIILSWQSTSSFIDWKLMARHH